MCAAGGLLLAGPAAASDNPPTATITSPTNSATYNEGAAIVANFSCSDPDGDVASCTASYVQDGVPAVNAVTNGQSLPNMPGNYALTVTAKDSEGNSGTAQAVYTVVDHAPTVTINTPANNGTYNEGSILIADYSCSDSDGAADLKSCTATLVGDGIVPDQTIDNGEALPTNNPRHVTSQAYYLQVTATDQSGKTTQVKSLYTVVEQPSVSITAPANGATYTQGQVVDANYACGDPDGDLDVKTCVGTLDGNNQLASGAPFNTSTLGQHALTVVATDTFGKTAQETVDYTVVAPVSNTGGGTTGGNTGGSSGGTTNPTSGTGSQGGGSNAVKSTQTKAPCSGLKQKALARCQARLAHQQKLAACRQLKSKKQRAACVKQAGAIYRRTLKLINKGK